MKSELDLNSLHRNTSSSSNSRSSTTRKILPFNYMRSSSSSTTTRTSNSSSNQYSYDIDDHDHIDLHHFSISSGSMANNPLVPCKYGRARRQHRPDNSSTSTTFNYKAATGGSKSGLLSIIRSLFCYISLPNFFTTSSTCRWMTIPSRLLTTSPITASSYSLGRKVTGTLFGYKKGHVSFAVQHDPRSEPVLLLELATSTSMLVKEMSSGLVRIALECERAQRGSSDRGGTRSINKLFQEPMWAMYCNGKKCGYAISRTCKESDWHVLSTVQTVSAGAGVIPMDKVRSGNWSEGELMFMRARFERVVGNRDSEAFYMLNPDGTGGPELSIFLLRI